jgi:hypothetical protein
LGFELVLPVGAGLGALDDGDGVGCFAEGAGVGALLDGLGRGDFRGAGLGLALALAVTLTSGAGELGSASSARGSSRVGPSLSTGTISGVGVSSASDVDKYQRPKAPPVTTTSPTLASTITITAGFDFGAAVAGAGG